MNSSRLTFPYYKFERFDIDAWDNSECWTELRFGRPDLDLLREKLQIPDEIACSQRSVCDGMEGMCILLKRLVYHPTDLCLIFNEMLDLIYTTHSHRLTVLCKTNANEIR